MQGSFKIELIAVDNWENPSRNLEIITYILESEKLDVLHVPKGYISCIQAVSVGCKLLVMSDLD